MNAIVLPSLLLVCTAADEKPPESKLPLGQETTFVTGPFDKHGYIDYETAAQRRVQQGHQAREERPGGSLMLVLGPTPERAEMPPAYFKWLDIPTPPKDGNYFLGFDTFNQSSLRLSPAQLEAASTSSRAGRRNGDGCPRTASRSRSG